MAAHWENEQQAALLKANDEAAQIKQAEFAKSAQSIEQKQRRIAALEQEAAGVRQEAVARTEHLGQVLGEERARSAALGGELTAAQREVELKATQLRQAREEIGQIKQTTERVTAELRQSLQQERDKVEAMARDLEAARHTVGVGVTSEPVASGPIAKTAKAVEVVASAKPTIGAQGSPEAMKLIARASVLLGRGDIGAARTVLERAVEVGSAQASFMLAETYDPGVLSLWATHGTRGEVAKARELYAKARAGGIQEAKDRLNALR